MACTCSKRLSASLGIVVLLASQVFAAGQVETPDAPYVTVSGGWAYFPNMSKVKYELRTSRTTKRGDTETKSAEVSIGQADYQFDLGLDVAVAGAVGYDFGLFRLEGEVSHASAGFKSKTTHSGNSRATGDDELKDPKLEELPAAYLLDEAQFAATRLLANVYYDVETGTRFRPYAGIGVGAVHLSVDNGQFAVGGWTLAYQGLAGIGVELVDGVDFRLGYRFFGTIESSLERKFSIDYTFPAATGSEVATVFATSSEVEVTQPIALIHQVELGVSYGY